MSGPFQSFTFNGHQIVVGKEFQINGHIWKFKKIPNLRRMLLRHKIPFSIFAVAHILKFLIFHNFHSKALPVASFLFLERFLQCFIHEEYIQIYVSTVSVVVLFFVSWAPFHFQRLGYVYFREHEYFRTVNQYLFYLSGCFYFLSSTLNPVLYNLMSAKYREAFTRALLCQPPNSPSRPTDNTCTTAATNLLNRCPEFQKGTFLVTFFMQQQLHGRAVEGVPGWQESE